MINFKEYFRDEYQFALKNISYTQLSPAPLGSDVSLNIIDALGTNLSSSSLELTFHRNVAFTPSSLYSLTVTFTCTLSFKDSSCVEKAQQVNWNDAFTNTRSPYLTNIASRASNLIAAITASYGQPPLITPPNLIKE